MRRDSDDDKWSGLTLRYSRERTLNIPQCVQGQGGHKIPIVPLAVRRSVDAPFLISVADYPDKYYQLPEGVERNYARLMSKYENADIYNNTNIRVDRISVQGPNLNLVTSRTSYFDSLVTNRAMDQPWEGKLTNREVYEPGPFIHMLQHSRLSNHLGYNGFIELGDGNIVFVVRRQNLSVGGGSLSPSVAASMKAAYCLEDDQTLSHAGITRAIRAETMDETGIDLGDDNDGHEWIFAAYRDLTEGGKPQFLFYSKAEEFDKQTFREAFFSPREPLPNSQDSKETVTDGDELVFIHRDQLVDCKISSGSITLPSGREIPMQPTATGSLVLLMHHLGIVEIPELAVL